MPRLGDGALALNSRHKKKTLAVGAEAYGCRGVDWAGGRDPTGGESRDFTDGERDDSGLSGYESADVTKRIAGRT